MSPKLFEIFPERNPKYKIVQKILYDKLIIMNRFSAQQLFETQSSHFSYSAAAVFFFPYRDQAAGPR